MRGPFFVTNSYPHLAVAPTVGPSCLAMSTPITRQPELISDKSRITAGCIGLGLVALGVILFFDPPTRETSEVTKPLADHTGASKKIIVDAEVASIAGVMIIAGAALLAFGINGLKITSFSSPVLNATTAPLAPSSLQASGDNARPALPAPSAANGFMIDASRLLDAYFAVSSWNGIKVVHIARRAAENGAAFDFRIFCSGDPRMTYDYAYGYLVASSSLGIFRHISDGTGAIITVSNFIPLAVQKLGEEIERRYLSDVVDGPTKRLEIERIDKFFAVASA